MAKFFSPTGNQFLFPKKEEPSHPANFDALERWLNTHVVTNITNPASSQPVLGRPGTGAVTVSSGGGGGAWTKISEVTVATTGNNVSFTSIPATYTHLAIIYSLQTAQTSGGYQIGMQFNGAGGSAYAWTFVSYQSGSVNGETHYNEDSIIVGYSDSPGSSGSPCAGEIFIPAYTQAVIRPVQFSYCTTQSLSFIPVAFTGGGAWTNDVNAINAILLFDDTAGTGFYAGGVATLFGIS